MLLTKSFALCSIDNKIIRQRPQAEKSTRLPIEENEQTTIGQREYSRPSRRPLTTQQAIPISTTLQDETETHDFFLDTKLTNRIRNSSPSSIITTSLLTPTIDSGKSVQEYLFDQVIKVLISPILKCLCAFNTKKIAKNHYFLEKSEKNP